MKKLLLLLSVLLFAVGVVTAQPWTENLPKENRKKEITFKDHQKAFYNYWKKYDVEKGYYIDNNGNKQKARGWKQFKRWEYYWESQVDTKTGAFPDKTAYQVFTEFHKSKATNSSSSKADWTSLGTNSSTGGYAGIGRINCIAYHPSDNNTYWVGTPAGGLWKTSDNGASWQVLTDENAVLGVSDIVIPSDYSTSKTIYIATGDRDAWDNRSIGVLKSVDDGLTWIATDLSFTVSQGRMCTRLLLDPDNDNIIIAATSSGVFKTTDGGNDWSTKLTSLSFIDMEYKPGDFNTLYGSTTNGQVYYSANGGVTWTASLNQGKRIELAVSQAADTVVYALASANDNGLHGVYKSVDSGQTFTEVYEGNKNFLGWDSDGSDDGGQGWYDLAIAASPSDANTILIGGVNTWRSTDGGISFSIVSHWWGDGVQAVHADKHMLNFRSNGDLFECNDGGVYYSQNNGTSWSDKTNGIVNSQMYKLSVSQQLEDEIITGLQDNGTKLYSESKWWDVQGGDGMDCLIDYLNYRIQYATTPYGNLNRTKNWWSSTSNITPSGAGDGAWVTPIIIDPTNHNTIYAGYADVWKSDNNGDSWTKISNINVSDKIRSMTIGQSDNNVIYAASRYTLYKTENGGSSWSNVTSGLSSGAITSIAVKHNDPQTVWVTLGGYDINVVYESTNGGSSWSNISSGLPSIPGNSVVQDTSTSSEVVLYLGTEAGVYKKVGAENWELFNDGLPNVKIAELEIYYDVRDLLGSKLRAATYGRGLWETPISVAAAPVIEITSVSNIGVNSVTAMATITENFDYEVSESGFLISKYSGVDMNDISAIKVKTNPLVAIGEYTSNISGLTQSSTYYIKAFAINQIGVGYSDELIFETECGDPISVLPYVNEFSIDSLPNCWQNIDNLSNDQVWQLDNPGSVGFISTTSDNGFASLNSENLGEGNTQDASLITPEFDFSNFTTLNISFAHLFKSEAGAKAELQYSLNGGTSWTTISEWTSSVGTTNAPDLFAKDISGIAGEASVLFSFNFSGTNDGYWCVDDLLLANEFSVLVNVNDIDTIAIPNALVDLGTQTLQTNFAGDAIFRTVSNTLLDFTVSAEGYLTETGTVDVNNTNASLNITLNTPPSTDASLDSLLLDNAMVEGFNTDILMYYVKLPHGTTELPVISAHARHSDAAVEITQATLETLTATVAVIAEDKLSQRTYSVIFEIMPEPTYTVTYNIMNELGEPVTNAFVSMLEMEQMTNYLGVVIFNKIHAIGDTIFEVTADNYDVYSGRVNIVDSDVDVDVVLLKTGLNTKVNEMIQIYPNPTSRFVRIKLADKIELANINIVDVNGKVIYAQDHIFKHKTIDLKGNKAGVYFVNLLIDNENYTQRIVLE